MSNPDVHNLGSFASIQDAWKRYPNGGGFGDYITVGSETVYWNEYSRSWGDQSESAGTERPAETMNHDIDVKGYGKFRDGIRVGEYVPSSVGAEIDKHGNSDFRTTRTDLLWVKHDGEYLRLDQYIKLFKTELPPDWQEYINAPLFDEIRILVFDPNTNEKYYTTIKSLKDVINSDNNNNGGGGGGGTIELIRSDDNSTTPTDSNAFSSLKTLLEISKIANEKLSRVKNDEAQGIIKFIQGLITKNIISPNYMPSMLGEGFQIDEFGNATFDSITARKYLSVPEIRFNRTTVYTGIRWDTFGGGKIKDVIIDYDEDGNPLQSGIIELELEDGEPGAVALDDFAMGIFHNFGGANDSTTEDQQNGNFRFKGFNTSYFRVTEILESDNSRFRYALRGISENWTQQHHPSQFMNFACYANPTNKDRQASNYTTVHYSIRLANMTTWEYGADNIYRISGRLDGFQVGDTILQGYGTAEGNGYFWGTLQQVYNNPVYMEIDNNGDGFLALGETMTITCRVMQGWDDITDTVETWSVTRETGNQSEDTAWNIAHTNFDGVLQITHTKEYTDLGNDLSTLFVFTAKAGENTASLHLTI